MGEAIAGIILLFVIPSLMVLIPALVSGYVLVFLIRKVIGLQVHQQYRQGFPAKLSWRLTFFVNTLTAAVISFFAKDYFYNQQDVGFVLTVGPMLIFYLSVPAAVIAAVLILAKILADGISKKSKSTQ